MVYMTPEAKAARAKYQREWRKKNPDKHREYEARKWEKIAAKIKAEEMSINNKGMDDGVL